MKSQALAAVASSSRPKLVSVVLRGGIMIVFSRRRGWNKGWNAGRPNACSDFDAVVFVCRVVCTASCDAEVEDGSTEDRYVDLGGNLDEDVLLPLLGVDQVADGEGDVGRVVCYVLVEDDVAPGLVEISACHDGERCNRLESVDIPDWSSAILRPPLASTCPS